MTKMQTEQQLRTFLALAKNSRKNKKYEKLPNSSRKKDLFNVLLLCPVKTTSIVKSTCLTRLSFSFKIIVGVGELTAYFG